MSPATVVCETLHFSIESVSDEWQHILVSLKSVVDLIVDPPIPHGLVASLGDLECRAWRGCDAACLEVADCPDEGMCLWLWQRIEPEFGQAHADAQPAEFMMWALTGFTGTQVEGNPKSSRSFIGRPHLRLIRRRHPKHSAMVIRVTDPVGPIRYQSFDVLPHARGIIEPRNVQRSGFEVRTPDTVVPQFGIAQSPGCPWSQCEGVVASVLE